MQKRRHASHAPPDTVTRPTGRAPQSQKDIAQAIIASTAGRLAHVPTAYRPVTISRNGVAALTYASKGDILSLDDYDGGTDNLIQWAITTDQVDRANDRVDPRGINVKRYMDNPVILWNHNAGNPPIGKGVGAPRQKLLPDGRRAVVLDILFHDVTREARDIAELVRGGFLSANSIGFIPLSFHDEPSDGYEDAYDWLDTVRTFDTWELLEDSICSIPMNPGALVQDGAKSLSVAVERGIIAADSPILRELSGPITVTMPPSNATIEEAAAILAYTPMHPLAAPLHRTSPPITTPRKSMPHDCSCAMLALVDADASAVLDFAATIADGDLAPEGRETEPHVTIKYGMALTNPKVLAALLADVPPITITLGEVSIFGADDNHTADVVKVDVVGRALVELNELIGATFECEDSYDEYNPHITLAYVKAGRGSSYEGPCDLTGTTIEFTDVTFSAPDGTVTTIPLGGSAPASITASATPTTMTTKEIAPAPDPNAAPPPVPPADTPAPEVAPSPALYNDAAYVDSVLAALQAVVAESAAAVVSSLDEAVKTAAQSAVDILTPGIEEFMALKEKLTPAVEPAPTPDAAPPADPAAAPVAPVASMSWRAKAGAVISAANKAHVEAIYVAASALKAAADSNTITEDPAAPKALSIRVDEKTVYINDRPLSDIMAEATGKIAASVALVAPSQAAMIDEGNTAVPDDSIATLKAQYAHLLDPSVT